MAIDCVPGAWPAGLVMQLTVLYLYVSVFARSEMVRYMRHAGTICSAAAALLTVLSQVVLLQS